MVSETVDTIMLEGNKKNPSDLEKMANNKQRHWRKTTKQSMTTHSHLETHVIVKK